MEGDLTYVPKLYLLSTTISEPASCPIAYLPALKLFEAGAAASIFERSVS
jgi:hypothetical protein